MFSWQLRFAVAAVLLLYMPNNVYARPPKEGFFSKFFDSVMPWRRATSEPPPTTTQNSDLESILNAIDTPNVKVTNGQLTLNETELLAVDSNGSNSVRIIDATDVIEKQKIDVPSTTPPSSESESESESAENQTRHPPFHRRLVANKCDKLSSVHKYRMLERIGAKNPIFMASTLKEGMHGFKPLISRKQSQQDKEFERLSDAIVKPQLSFNLDDDDESSNELDDDEDGVCDDFCREVASTIRSIEKEEEKEQKSEQQFLRASFDVPYHDNEEVENRALREPPLCKLDNFIPHDKECNQRGSADGHEGFAKLCTACQGIYKLANNCFPNMINGIQCSKDQEQSNCIFVREHQNGECKSKTLPLTILRNIGTTECENWVKEVIDVPIACECYLDDRSSLSAVPMP